MLKACEMWLYKNVLKIKYTDKIKNIKMRSKMEVTRQLINVIKIVTFF